MPLRSGNEQLAIKHCHARNKKIFEEDLELLESVASIGSAIKRIILTDQEKEAARINERNRLRDLHDSVNQMLFSLKITAHAAKGITDHEEARKFQQLKNKSKCGNEMRA